MPRRTGVIALIIFAGLLLTALQAALSRPLKLHRQHAPSHDTARLQGLAARLLAEEPDWDTQGLNLTQTVIKWREDSGLSLCAEDLDVLPVGGGAAPSIPKTMHATTKDKSQDLPHLQGCKEMNPDWELRLVDDAGMLEDVASFAPSLLPMFRILTPVEQADVWRYLVLLFRGGVYVDTDVQCVTPFSQWQAALHSSKPAGLLVGLESVQAPSAFEHQWPLQFCQWTIASAPQQPLLIHAIDTLVAQFIHSQRWKISRAALTRKHILWSAGPAIWTFAITTWLNQEGHDVLVLAMQSPTVVEGVGILGQQAFGYSPGGQCPESYPFKQLVTPDSPQLVAHHFASSWKAGLN